MASRILVAAYLIAIVAANLLAARFGRWVTPIVGFFTIGFDLTCRCILQEQWRDRKNWRRNMALLIGAGGILTCLINWNARHIALASMVAFTSGEALDALIYTSLRRGGVRILWCINGANLFSALLDSIVFCWLAFGRPYWGVIALEHLAKFTGGWLWSLLLIKFIKKDKYVYTH